MEVGIYITAGISAQEPITVRCRSAAHNAPYMDLRLRPVYGCTGAHNEKERNQQVLVSSTQRSLYGFAFAACVRMHRSP